jgi:hypothetical protein
MLKQARLNDFVGQVKHDEDLKIASLKYLMAQKRTI